jgi:hypothetical protein
MGGNMIYDGSFQYGELTKPHTRHIYLGKAASFLVGVAAIILSYIIGFETCKNIVGWINSPVTADIPSPVAGMSGELNSTLIIYGGGGGLEPI